MTALPTINDLWFAWLQMQLPAGVVAGTSNPVPGQNAGQQNAESLNAYGTQTNPGADTVIASHTTPPAGLYDVYVKYGLTGSGFTGADINNFCIKRAATAVITRMMNPNNSPTNASDFPSLTIRVRVDGTQDISVRNVAAPGVATVTYNANLIITRRGD